MPIGRAVNAIGTGAFVNLPGVVAANPLQAGLAVGITPAGELSLCSATTTGYTFVGFVLANTAQGAPVSVLSMRGSAVTPTVEGGVPLVPGAKVFLANTLGEVTQTPPTGPGTTSVQVGIATSATQFTLITDQRVLL